MTQVSKPGSQLFFPVKSVLGSAGGSTPGASAALLSVAATVERAADTSLKSLSLAQSAAVYPHRSRLAANAARFLFGVAWMM